MKQRMIAIITALLACVLFVGCTCSQTAVEPVQEPTQKTDTTDVIAPQTATDAPEQSAQTDAPEPTDAPQEPTEEAGAAEITTNGDGDMD